MIKRLLVLAITGFMSCAVFASDNADETGFTSSSADLIMADTRSKDRREDRKDDRDDKQDCRQEEGRLGDDKRECKQENRGEGDEAEEDAEEEEGTKA
jgi:hypothetical protein